MEIRAYRRGELPRSLQRHANSYEEKFELSFEQYRLFPSNQLHELHGEGVDLGGRVSIARSETIGSLPDVLAEIAHMRSVYGDGPDGPTDEQRAQYLDAVLSIYRGLQDPPVSRLNDPAVQFLGVEREGRMIAERLGWLPADHSRPVHAKRMSSLAGGLLVGLQGVPAVAADDLVIVDGAIASGATLISIVDALEFRTVHIYSAHAAEEGLRALCRYADSRGIDLKVSVGFVTPGLNPGFYAEIDGREVVGDLGDTIARICPPA